MTLFDTISNFVSSDLGQTLVGVGGDLAAGYLGSQAAGDAAAQQTAALNKATGVSEKAIKQGRKDILGTFEPGLEDLITGFQGAIKTLEAPGQAETQALALSGAAGPEAEQAALDAFMESPGQQFLREQGEQAIMRNQAATGGLGGGRIGQALIDYGIGTAAQNLQQRLGNISSLIQPETQRSANIANILSSGGGQLAQYRSGIGTNLANLAIGGASQQIPLITGTGTAQAAGTVGQGSATQQSMGNISETLGRIYG